MKKFTVLLMASVMMLSGCTKKNDTPVITDNTENSVTTEKTSTVAKTSESNNNDIQYIGNYSYYQNGVAYQAGSVPNNTEMFLDFDSMEKASLCAVPNCNHMTSSCLAKSMGRYEPIFYNDYIYFFSTNGGQVRETPDGSEFYIDSSLKKSSLDSYEVQTVCEFHDCVPHETSNYVLYDNELFFVADDRGAVKDDYGNYSWGNSGGDFFLCSVNLDTYEYTNYGSICDDDKVYDGAKNSRGSNIRGVYDGKMYITHSFIKDQNADSTSDDYWTNWIFEFNFDTKSWKKSDLNFPVFMNQDCYISYDMDDKTAKVIWQGEEFEFNLGFDIYSFRLSLCSEFNGKVFFPTVDKWFDLKDLSEHSMGEYADYEVIGYRNDSYILRKEGKIAKITENELLSL
ncbi:MAG: hypothetical protein K2G36_06115 [Ruminococcus sp.]|nr:hypothetical protein [Ruminococcus sp.]